MKKVVKKTIDMPVELFDKIMTFAYSKKIYKFSPSVIQLLESALDAAEKEDA